MYCKLQTTKNIKKIYLIVFWSSDYRYCSNRQSLPVIGKFDRVCRACFSPSNLRPVAAKYQEGRFSVFELPHLD